MSSVFNTAENLFCAMVNLTIPLPVLHVKWLLTHHMATVSPHIAGCR